MNLVWKVVSSNPDPPRENWVIKQGQNEIMKMVEDKPPKITIISLFTLTEKPKQTVFNVGSNPVLWVVLSTRLMFGKWLENKNSQAGQNKDQKINYCF